MRLHLAFATALLSSFCVALVSRAEGVLFEDTFDKELSKKWEIIGLGKDDYRIRDGALEIRVQPKAARADTAMIKVNLPFRTSETVIASVEVSIVGEPLKRGEVAELLLTDASGWNFGARKTSNLDGFFVFSPGEVDFIGKPGEEGDPGKYTVKYWPADKAAGPLNIIVRQDYAHFQVGPSTEGKYHTFFHSAIRKGDTGMGFGLSATGKTEEGDRWVRFDNFRVERR